MLIAMPGERLVCHCSGDRTGQSNKHGIGWEYVHVAIDDASRLATTAPR